MRPLTELCQGCRTIDAFPTVQGRETSVDPLVKLSKLRYADFLMLFQEP
jgi:hypothetical protein